LIEVGRMVLNRNPENYFAEVEQATFSPGTLVPGIDVSPDKMLQGRLFAYADAHRYRVGANHQHLPINRAKSEVNSYQRDGQMRFDGNGGKSVNYEPNSFGGPTEVNEHKQASFPVSGVAENVGYDHHDHYTQAGDLYRLMSEEERARLVANIVGAMKPVERDDIKLRQIAHFYKADPEYGTRIAQGLGLQVPQEV
jgi:catalase